MKNNLKKYKTKRNFSKTPEPKGKKTPSKGNPIFVVQKHKARNLHYDLRIEIDGVLESWAVPKGPAIAPAEKRLAIPTEAHPIEYANFEGVIPEGEYGAGTVMVWDKGTYKNLKKKGGKEISMKSCYKKGQIEIELKGKKLKGGFSIVRFRNEPKPMWLFIKMKDSKAKTGEDILKTKPNSALSGKSLKQIENKSIKKKVAKK